MGGSLSRQPKDVCPPSGISPEGVDKKNPGTLLGAAMKRMEKLLLGSII
jgi:hypothetical protein